MKTRVILLATLLSLAGCVSLTPAGQHVKYTNSDTARYAGCKRLPGLIETDNPYVMRNRAAEAGATNVNIVEESHTPVPLGGAIIIVNKYVAEAYVCPTDVGGLQ